jgi:hypothetical protein
MNRNTCFDTISKYCYGTSFNVVKSDKDLGLIYIVKKGDEKNRLIQIYFRPGKESILITTEVEKLIREKMDIVFKSVMLGKRYNYEKVSDSFILKVCNTYISNSTC